MAARRRKILALCAIIGLVAIIDVVVATELSTNKAVSPQMGKLDETDASAEMTEPNFGYVGELGAFQVTTHEGAEGMIVVHAYPDHNRIALAETKLDYEGPKRVGNVNGWVFKTKWDGTKYPSRIFFSSEQVYFGGGESAFIASDFREQTGWVWKMIPLRQTQLAEAN
jgi:hypothetical protein